MQVQVQVLLWAVCLDKCSYLPVSPSPYYSTGTSCVLPLEGPRISSSSVAPGLWQRSVNTAEVTMAITILLGELDLGGGGREGLEYQSQMLGFQSPGGGSPSRL